MGVYVKRSGVDKCAINEGKLEVKEDFLRGKCRFSLLEFSNK